MDTTTDTPSDAPADTPADPTFDARYLAVTSRDARFDGRFFTCVLSTGIYCRPSCPARTPARHRVRFQVDAAGAEAAGFRACRRCRPDLAPDAPDVDIAGDLTSRALHLISAGVVDHHGVEGLAERLHVSSRHLTRVLTSEVGAGPLRVARSRRARLARQLLERTDLPLTEIAHAAGFASVRTFNATFREVFDATPSELRAKRRSGERDRLLRVRLAVRAPLPAVELRAFLAARALPGVETVDGTYRREVAAADGGTATLELDLAEDGVEVGLSGEPAAGLLATVHAVRQLLDLGADPGPIAEVLAADPALAPLLARSPGRRVVGTLDPWEGAARIVLNQQVSVVAAVTLAGRLVTRLGGGVAFPAAAAVAEADLDGLGMPGSRIRALRGLAAAVADREVVLDGSVTVGEARDQLAALPGIGPWTVDVIAMRVLRDPDAFPGTDLGVRQAAVALGLPDGRALLEHAERWRPWRAYAVHHLWAHLATAPPAPRTTARVPGPASAPSDRQASR